MTRLICNHTLLTFSFFHFENKNNYFSLKTKITIFSWIKNNYFSVQWRDKKKYLKNICAITLLTEWFDSKNSSKYLRYYFVLTEGFDSKNSSKYLRYYLVLTEWFEEYSVVFSIRIIVFVFLNVLRFEFVLTKKTFWFEFFSFFLFFSLKTTSH